MSAQKLGIGKTELLTAYYPDELGVVIGIFCEKDENASVEAQQVDVMEFLGE